MCCKVSSSSDCYPRWLFFIFSYPVVVVFSTAVHSIQLSRLRHCGGCLLGCYIWSGIDQPARPHFIVRLPPTRQQPQQQRPTKLRLSFLVHSIQSHHPLNVRSLSHSAIVSAFNIHFIIEVPTYRIYIRPISAQWRRRRRRCTVTS